MIYLKLSVTLHSDQEKQKHQKVDEFHLETRKTDVSDGYEDNPKEILL